jgi:hypothetical protein
MQHYKFLTLSFGWKSIFLKDLIKTKETAMYAESQAF